MVGWSFCLGMFRRNHSIVCSVFPFAEDNFFGPVSASFIRPDQLSDSAASYDNYEDTMDTTAFSMHYRSLVRSDSGEEPKTPTAVSLAFEEKTPTQITNPADSTSLMEITEPKKLTSESVTPARKVRGGEDSNEMSIVEENPNRYDYGRLSPTIDALLAEGSKDLHTGSATLVQNDATHINETNGELGNSDSHEMTAEAASLAGVKLHEANGACLDQIANDCLSNQNSGLAAAASPGHRMQSPDQLFKVRVIFLSGVLVNCLIHLYFKFVEPLAIHAMVV